MTADQTIATQVLRKEVVDGMVKQTVAQTYKFKQALSVVPTSAWKNYFFRENTTELSGATGNATKGIPRGAEFPQAIPQWEKLSATIEKYGLEAYIPYEDLISDDIDVRNRTIIKIARGVAKAVDDQIWSTITSDANIQTIDLVTEGVTYGSGRWDESSAAIVGVLGGARQLIAEQNYPTDNVMVFLSPKDNRLLSSYIADKGAQWTRISEDVVGGNGLVGAFMGFKIVESNSVTASQALVVIPKTCGSWKELVPLTTVTKVDEGKSATIRSYELGVCQVTDPKAIVWIKGTQK